MCFSVLEATLAKSETGPRRFVRRDAGIRNQILLFVLRLREDGECHIDTTTTAAGPRGQRPLGESLSGRGSHEVRKVTEGETARAELNCSSECSGAVPVV